MDSDTQIKKSYYAVIPADVRYSKVPQGAKLLYGEITALCNAVGFCWASNKYFADLYGVDDRTIRRWISALEKENFIYSEVIGKKRKIFLTQNFNRDDTGLPDEPTEKKEVASTPKKKAKPKKSPAGKKAVESKKARHKYDDNDLFLAEMLLSKIIYNFPEFENKKVNISEWADDIRKLREIDKARPDQIAFMITWVQGGEIEIPGKPPRKFEPHDFWAKNIMSAHKLRKQWFENLVPQLQQKIKKTVKKETVAKL